MADPLPPIPKSYQEILGKDFDIPPELLGPRQSIIFHGKESSTHLNTIVDIGTKLAPNYQIVPLLTPNQVRIEDLLKGVPPAKDQIQRALDYGTVVGRGGYPANIKEYPGHETLSQARKAEEQFRATILKDLDPYTKKMRSTMDYTTPKHLGGLRVSDEITLQALKDMKKDPLLHDVAHKASKLGPPISMNVIPDMYQKSVDGKRYEEPGTEGRYNPALRSASASLGASTWQPPMYTRDTLAHELQHAINQFTGDDQGYSYSGRESVDEGIAHGLLGTPAMKEAGIVNQSTRQTAREALIKMYGDVLFKKLGGLP